MDVKEVLHNPFAIMVHLSGEICILNKTEDINVKVFNVILFILVS